MQNQRTITLALALIISLCLSPLLHSSPKPKHIAITTIVEHPALMQTKKGILDALKTAGYDEKSLKITDETAQGQMSTSLMIAKKYITQKPDAIVAISTPSAQSVVNAAKNTEIPIVFAAVTSPINAGLIKDLKQPEALTTGVMDAPPLMQTLQLIKALTPQTKRIGVVYNASEANSVQTVNQLKAQLGDLVLVEALAANSNQVGDAFLSLVGKVDVVLIPSDNTVYSCLPLISRLSYQHRLPVYTNDSDAVKSGLMASCGYNQYQVGLTAGQLLVRILNGEHHIKVQTPLEWEITVNQKMLKHFGLVCPETILGKKVVKI